MALGAVGGEDMIKRRFGEITTMDTRSEANDSVNKSLRYSQIIECLRERPEMTAKEIAVRMCEKGYIPTTERNFTAPRLTEMSQRGIVEPVGKKKCIFTGRKVAVYSLCEEQMEMAEV